MMRSLTIAGAVLSFAASSLCAVQGNLTKPLSSKLLLAGDFSPPPVFINTNLVHIINLERNYAKETVNVVIENISEEPQSDYYVPFPSWQMAKIGGFEAKDRKNTQGGLFRVSPAEYSEQSDTQFYVIHLPTPLAPKAQLILGISYSLLTAFTPLPATIAQKDKQYLTYEFSAISPSTYETTKQKTEVKFPTTNIPEYTILKEGNGAPESPQKQGTKFTYGTFENIPAGAVNPVKVRYEFTKPLIHVSKLERDIEVSHWGGNVAFEERYTLHNRAANLTTQFSRVEYAQSSYYNPPTIALKSLVFPLKVGSLSPYYTDVIGNVSTSRFRSNKREANLEIKPRYPVFGGWNYPFRIGWDADSKRFLRRSSGRTYVLNVPFLEGPKQAEGIEYQHLEVRVILPEGAINVQYSTTVPLVDVTQALHRTFMDTKGRTALTLTAYNVVDDVRDRELFITYDYPLSAALRKPLVIFSATLSLFLAVWAIGQVDTGIKAKSI